MMKLDQCEITHCTCKECISYCEKRPGWFRPSEMPRLAKFLEIPLKEAFRKYLIADFWIGEETNIHVLSPVKDFDRIKSGEMLEMLEIHREMHREHNELMGRANFDRPGSRASYGYAFIHAPCIFLENNRCRIYAARPFECAVGWHKMKKSTSSIRELIAKEWKKSKLIDEL